MNDLLSRFLVEFLDDCHVYKGYPFFDILKQDGKEIIRIAVAGFTKDNLSVTFDKNLGQLTIEGKPEAVPSAAEYRVCGISSKHFKRIFHLSKYSSVPQSGISLKDGILTIEIVKDVPEGSIVTYSLE